MTYSIGSYGFVRWQGPAPQLIKQHVRTFSKVGQSGIAAQLLGTFGDPFDVELEAHFDNQTNTSTAENAYRALIGASPQTVVYNGVNYSSAYSHTYLVLDVGIVEIKRCPRLMGISYDYAGGYRVRSRWRLQPIA